MTKRVFTLHYLIRKLMLKNYPLLRWCLPSVVGRYVSNTAIARRYSSAISLHQSQTSGNTLLVPQLSPQTMRERQHDSSYIDRDCRGWSCAADSYFGLQPSVHNMHGCMFFCGLIPSPHPQKWLTLPLQCGYQRAREEKVLWREGTGSRARNRCAPCFHHIRGNGPSCSYSSYTKDWPCWLLKRKSNHIT